MKIKYDILFNDIEQILKIILMIIILMCIFYIIVTISLILSETSFSIINNIKFYDWNIIQITIFIIILYSILKYTDIFDEK